MVYRIGTLRHRGRFIYTEYRGIIYIFCLVCMCVAYRVPVALQECTAVIMFCCYNVAAVFFAVLRDVAPWVGFNPNFGTAFFYSGGPLRLRQCNVVVAIVEQQQ